MRKDEDDVVIKLNVNESEDIYEFQFIGPLLKITKILVIALASVMKRFGITKNTDDESLKSITSQLGEALYFTIKEE